MSILKPNIPFHIIYPRNIIPHTYRPTIFVAILLWENRRETKYALYYLLFSSFKLNLVVYRSSRFAFIWTCNSKHETWLTPTRNRPRPIYVVWWPHITTNTNLQTCTRRTNVVNLNLCEPTNSLPANASFHICDLTKKKSSHSHSLTIELTYAYTFWKPNSATDAHKAHLEREKNESSGVHSAHRCALLAPITYTEQNRLTKEWPEMNKQKTGSREKKNAKQPKIIFHLMAEQCRASFLLAIHFFGAYFDGSLWSRRMCFFYVFCYFYLLLRVCYFNQSCCCHFLLLFNARVLAHRSKFLWIWKPCMCWPLNKWNKWTFFVYAKKEIYEQMKHWISRCFLWARYFRRLVFDDSHTFYQHTNHTHNFNLVEWTWSKA